MAKHIAAFAPKYKKIIEPFGSYGTIAMEPSARKAKEHVLNVENIVVFNLMLFIQNITTPEKKNLKQRDWIGSQEAFDKAVSITATEGVDFYYKYMYLKEFAEMQMEGETPMYDWTLTGVNIKSDLFDLITMKLALKKVTLTNLPYATTLNSAGGSDTFYILTPQTPEEVTACESRVAGLSSLFFFAKKSSGGEELLVAVANKKLKTSVMNQSSIMVNTMQVQTNYINRLPNLNELIVGTKMKM